MSAPLLRASSRWARRTSICRSAITGPISPSLMSSVLRRKREKFSASAAYQFIVNALLHIDAFNRKTGLARVSRAAPGERGSAALDIDNLWRRWPDPYPPSSRKLGIKCCACCLAHLLAGCNATGEYHHIDMFPVTRHLWRRLPGLAAAAVPASAQRRGLACSGFKKSGSSNFTGFLAKPRCRRAMPVSRR